MLEVFEPLPHPFAHLAHTPSFWVVPSLRLRPGAEDSTQDEAYMS